MPFNVEAFESAEFSPRQKSVSVPALAGFFDSPPYEWTVRGLTAAEIHRAMEAAQRNRDLGKVAEAISRGGVQVQEIRDALGLSEKVPGEIAKRIDMLAIGSVDPVISQTVAVKLAEAFPIEFLQLTNTITELSGEGAEMGKPEPASQETQTSETP